MLVGRIIYNIIATVIVIITIMVIIMFLPIKELSSLSILIKY